MNCGDHIGYSRWITLTVALMNFLIIPKTSLIRRLSFNGPRQSSAPNQTMSIRRCLNFFFWITCDVSSPIIWKRLCRQAIAPSSHCTRKRSNRRSVLLEASRVRGQLSIRPTRIKHEVHHKKCQLDHRFMQLVSRTTAPKSFRRKFGDYPPVIIWSGSLFWWISLVLRLLRAPSKKVSLVFRVLRPSGALWQIPAEHFSARRPRTVFDSRELFLAYLTNPLEGKLPTRPAT